MRTYQIIAAHVSNEDGSEVWNLYKPSYDTGECIGEFPTIGEACEFALMQGLGPIKIDVI